MSGESEAQPSPSPGGSGRGHGPPPSRDEVSRSEPPSADEPPARDAPPATPGSVESPSDLRRALEDEGGSTLAKYRALAVGRQGLWPLVKYELAMTLLAPLPGAVGYALRKLFYPYLLGGMGKGVVIGRNVTLRHPHRVWLGDGVVVDDFAVLDGKGTEECTISVGDRAIIGRNTVLSCKDGTIRLGPRANLSVNCTLISETRVEVEDRVLVAGHCYIIAGGNHGLERLDVPIVDQPRVEKGGVRIRQNAWLGAQVAVLDGVTVGRDSVVAAGAVVNRPVEDFTVVGGVPARTLRQR